MAAPSRAGAAGIMRGEGTKDGGRGRTTTTCRSTPNPLFPEGRRPSC